MDSQTDLHFSPLKILFTVLFRTSISSLYGTLLNQDTVSFLTLMPQHSFFFLASSSDESRYKL